LRTEAKRTAGTGISPWAAIPETVFSRTRAIIVAEESANTTGIKGHSRRRLSSGAWGNRTKPSSSPLFPRGARTMFKRPLSDANWKRVFNTLVLPQEKGSSTVTSSPVTRVVRRTRYSSGPAQKIFRGCPAPLSAAARMTPGGTAPSLLSSAITRRGIITAASPFFYGMV